jgi:hypothetical protein
MPLRSYSLGVYSGRLIGLLMPVIQSLHMDDPKALADYIANPQMLKQDDLDAETRLAVAKELLEVKS